MVTVRLRKRLGVLQKGLVQRAARNDRRGDVGQAEQLRVQARLADTSQAPFTDEWPISPTSPVSPYISLHLPISPCLSQAPFTDEWPEEQCMHWLASQRVPVVVVTDDVHYQVSARVGASATDSYPEPQP